MSARVAFVLGLSLLVACGACDRRDEEEKKKAGAADSLVDQMACGKGDKAACAAHLARTRKRCDTGDADGCVLLGIMYQVGSEGLTKDPPAALPLFTKACDAKSGAGCWYLGSAYDYGRGTERDIEAARVAYQKSCDLRHDNGCISLGDLYSSPGPRYDHAKALAAYDAACAIPYKGGCERAAALRAKP